jgi:hypothetical protein
MIERKAGQREREQGGEPQPCTVGGLPDAGELGVGVTVVPAAIGKHVILF